MRDEASAFALSQFLAELRQKRSLFEGGTRGSSTRLADEYWQGLAREHAAVLAHGVQCGVFGRERGAREIAALVDDAFGPGRYGSRLKADGDRDATRLPPTLSIEQLLTSRPAMDPNPEAFLAYLRFRHFSQSFETDSFAATLLFESDERWEQLLASAIATLPGDLMSGRPATHLAFGYDAISLAAAALTWRRGLPLDAEDPWAGLFDQGRPARGVIVLRELRTLDSIRIGRLIDALDRLSSEVRPGTLTDRLLNEYFLIRLMVVARIREFNLDRSPVNDAVFNPTFNAERGFLTAFALGSPYTWALSLWRWAPSDPRSVARLMDIDALLARTLPILLGASGRDSA